jgi:hypothetical protein
MNKMVVGLCIAAVSLVPAYAEVAGGPRAQSACALTEANAPAVRTVKLGMGVDQLVALFPAGAKRREVREAVERARNPAGNAPVTLVFNASADGGGERFAGVDTVSATVHRGRVIAFSVFYAGTSWSTVDEWVAKVAEAYGLPAASRWAAGPGETPNKVLACNGIEVEAAIQGGGSSISVRNRELLKGADERVNTGEEKKRREFKP